MLGRNAHADDPVPPRTWWLWAVVAGLVIALFLAALHSCRERAADRPRVTPDIGGSP